MLTSVPCVLMVALTFLMALQGYATGNDNVEGARFAFSRSGPMDYPEVTMEIGRPARTYRLRLMFDVQRYRALSGGACAGGAHLTIFHPNHFLSSATFEVIEDGACGRDVVDFTGARWEALVAVVAENKLPDRPSRVDGVWLISPLDCTTPQCGWRYFLNTRHMFLADAEPVERHATSQVEGGAGCRIPLNDASSPPPDSESALEGTTKTHIGWCSMHVLIGQERVRPDPYRIVIAPDAHTSYLPVTLFQRYFNGRNLFREDSTAWPNLILSSPDCQVSLASHTLFPLSYMYPDAGPVRERFIGLIMQRRIWPDDNGNLDRGKARKGYNALKVHPQHLDNDTIILAGNVFWGNLGIAVDQVAHRTEIVTYPHRHELTAFDVLYLGLLAILYARWLLSGMWLDTCDTQQLYMIMLTNYGLLASAALALLKILVGYPLYYGQVTRFLSGLTAHHNTAAVGINALIALSISADALTVLFAFSIFRRALSRAVRGFATSVAGFMREWRSGGDFLDKKPDAEWREHHHHPYVNERLPYNRGRWDPRRAYADHPRNRPFSWYPPEQVACYTLLVDLVFTTAVWFVAVASDDIVITDVITSVAFTVAVYTSMQYTVLLFETLRPTWRAGHWPRPQSVFTLLLVFMATVGVAAFTGRFVIRRMLDDYWTEYHNAALDVVVVFYMLVLLLAAKLMVRHIFSVYIVAIGGPGDHQHRPNNPARSARRKPKKQT